MICPNTWKVVALMPKYDSITKQITKVNAVIDFKDFKEERVKVSFEPLKKYLDQLCNVYGFIFHNRDVLPSGSLKTYHIHCVFTLKKKKRISTIINDLANACSVDTLAVTVESMTSFEGSFQYLIHQNNPEKYQYAISDVVTNMESDEVDTVLTARSVGIGFAEIKAICISSPNLLEVIDRVGIGTYQHYRATIRDIWDLVSVLRRDVKPLETSNE